MQNAARDCSRPSSVARAVTAFGSVKSEAREGKDWITAMLESVRHTTRMRICFAPKCQTTLLTRLEAHADLNIDQCLRCYDTFFDTGAFLEYSELTLMERFEKFWPLK